MRICGLLTYDSSAVNEMRDLVERVGSSKVYSNVIAKI